jgi:hypothetical protein
MEEGLISLDGLKFKLVYSSPYGTARDQNLGKINIYRIER